MHVSLQAVPLSGHAGVVEVVGWVADGVSTTEARLIATVGLLLVAALAAGLVVPLVARAVRNVATRTLDRRGDEALREAVDAVPWRAALALSIRLSQVAVVALAGVGLLVVWGQVSLAVEAWCCSNSPRRSCSAESRHSPCSSWRTSGRNSSRSASSS